MLVGGVQLFMFGIMGEYIGKIFSELKARPIYLVAEESLKTAEGSAAQTEQDHAENQSKRTAAE
jgi:hypothetical protein